eukprot:jgi/Tetstr1/441845/TSEL_030060.t1
MLARPEVACREVPCGIDWRLLGTNILCRLRQHEASGDVVASAEAAPAEPNPIPLRLLLRLLRLMREQRRRFDLAAILVDRGFPADGGAQAEELRSVDLHALRDRAGRPVLTAAIAEQRPQEREPQPCFITQGSR